MDGASPTKYKWVLTQEAFDRLLAWLDPDREEAGNKYEQIRLRLIKIFIRRRCNSAEDLADETINRVAKKLLQIEESYINDPELYFYGVAKIVHLQYVQQRPDPLPPPPPDPTEEVERNHQCLGKCMKRLAGKDRKLILEYYRGEKQAKIEQRRKLAERLGIGIKTLRTRAHRIKADLRICVGECLNQTAVG